MKHKTAVTVLVVLIGLLSILATGFGIFSSRGPGEYVFRSVHGQAVMIYGKGLYRYMSADVAIQGIAQDYVTLFVAVPLLFIALFRARKNSLRGLFVLSGTLGYFLLTYLFYTAMAMYNALFLVYTALLGTSFFAFILTLFSYDTAALKDAFRSVKLVRLAGIFLVANAGLVALLWLSVVVPPLLDGSVIPARVQHYTTLIVQGFDLGLFLPMAVVSGMLAVRRNPFGYLFTTIYMVFLSLLMTALTAKILFMARAGVNVVPAVFIMPSICVIAITLSLLLLKNIQTQK